MKRFLLAPVAVAAALISTGLASGSSGYPYPATSSGGHSSTRSGVAVAVAKSKLGRILVDSRGRTLYLFQKDKSMASTCYTSCASVWPPLTTAGRPHAVRGAVASKLGSWKRKDGTLQVTYNGHPLYYYAGDNKAGQTNGQNLDQFGAEWYVLSPAGKKIDKG